MVMAHCPLRLPLSLCKKSPGRLANSSKEAMAFNLVNFKRAGLAIFSHFFILLPKKKSRVSLSLKVAIVFSIF